MENPCRPRKSHGFWLSIIWVLWSIIEAQSIYCSMWPAYVCTVLMCFSCTRVQIEKDFEIFPGKAAMMFERWTQLSLKVLELVRKSVKDASIQRLLKLLEGTSDNGVYPLQSVLQFFADSWLASRYWKSVVCRLSVTIVDSGQTAIDSHDFFTGRQGFHLGTPGAKNIEINLVVFKQ